MDAAGDSSSGTRIWPGPAAACIVWGVAAAYLAGGTALIQLLLLLTGVLLPVAALAADALRPTGLDDELRACAAAVVATLAAAPVHYARRLLPIPHLVFDVIVVAVALGGALYSGALRRFLRIASSPVLRASGWLAAVAIPLVICLVWMGFEVRDGGVVRYHGLFPIDFSNLANMVTTIRVSPGLPLLPTAGSGPAYYHWWFFALPAWLSDFAGLRCRSSTALILSNLVMASLLAMTVSAAVWRHLAERAELSVRARLRAVRAGAVVATIAPFSVYAYQFVVSHLHLSWFTMGQRNSLLLSVLNSMTTFGNNTLALVAAVTIAAAVGLWNDRPSVRLGALISFLFVAVLGSSVTLAFPVALSLAAWFVMGGVANRGRFLIGVVPVAVLGLVALRLTHVLGSSGDRLVFAFDRGQFLQNVAFSMAPLWVLAAVAVRAGLADRRWTFPALLVGAGILVPSFLMISSVRADPSVMSMKIGSLIAVASAPLVADGLVALATRRMRVWRAVAALALAAGLVNGAAYAGQFAVYRVFNRGRDRAVELPAAYVDALDYVRRETPPSALVVDPSSGITKVTVTTLLVAERRVWLPSPFGTEIAGWEAGKPQILSRADTWRAWERSGFRDEAIASAIADEADVVVGPPTIASAAWTKQRDFDGYAVYVSTRAPGGRRAE